MKFPSFPFSIKISFLWKAVLFIFLFKCYVILLNFHDVISNFDKWNPWGYFTRSRKTEIRLMENIKLFFKSEIGWLFSLQHGVITWIAAIVSVWTNVRQCANIILIYAVEEYQSTLGSKHDWMSGSLDD